MNTEPHMRARCFVRSFGLIYLCGSRSYVLWLESGTTCEPRYNATCPVHCAHLGSCPVSRAPSGAVPHPGTMIVWPTNRWGLTVAAACPQMPIPAHVP